MKYASADEVVIYWTSHQDKNGSLPWSSEHRNLHASSCWACSRVSDDEAIFERAHVVARRLGGNYKPENLVILCSLCHAILDQVVLGDNAADTWQFMASRWNEDLHLAIVGSTSQRTSHALAQRRAEGVHLGRPPVLPQAVRDRIVTERNAGRTLQAICDGLNDEGIATGQGGAKWYPSTVLGVYRRETQLGRSA
jgi:HNH endonuclease/Recombinase